MVIMGLVFVLMETNAYWYVMDSMGGVLFVILNDFNETFFIGNRQKFCDGFYFLLHNIRVHFMYFTLIEVR